MPTENGREARCYRNWRPDFDPGISTYAEEGQGHPVPPSVSSRCAGFAPGGPPGMVYAQPRHPREGACRKTGQTRVSAPLSVMEVLVLQWRGHSCPRTRNAKPGFFNKPEGGGPAPACPVWIPPPWRAGMTTGDGFVFRGHARRF